jgi:hypothetical protein
MQVRSIFTLLYYESMKRNEDQLEFTQLGNPHKGSLDTTNPTSNISADPRRVPSHNSTVPTRVSVGATKCVGQMSITTKYDDLRWV